MQLLYALFAFVGATVTLVVAAPVQFVRRSATTVGREITVAIGEVKPVTKSFPITGKRLYTRLPSLGSRRPRQRAGMGRELQRAKKKMSKKNDPEESGDDDPDSGDVDESGEDDGTDKSGTDGDDGDTNSGDTDPGDTDDQDDEAESNDKTSDDVNRRPRGKGRKQKEKRANGGDNLDNTWIESRSSPESGNPFDSRNIILSDDIGNDGDDEE